MFRGVLSVAERAHFDDPHHAVIHEESIDALPQLECNFVEIQTKGDTTSTRVLLVVDSSTGYLGATDVDERAAVLGFCCKNGWLSSWIPLAIHE